MQDVDAANYVLVKDALAGLELHVTLVNADIENTKTNMHTRILYDNTHVSEIQQRIVHEREDEQGSLMSTDFTIHHSFQRLLSCIVGRQAILRVVFVLLTTSTRARGY